MIILKSMTSCTLLLKCAVSFPLNNIIKTTKMTVCEKEIAKASDSDHSDVDMFAPALQFSTGPVKTWHDNLYSTLFNRLH